MRSYWKIKLWAKFVNHFDVFDNLWSRKTQCDHSTWQYFNHYISPFVGYWHTLENQEIRLVKTMEHLSKAADYLFS